MSDVKLSIVAAVEAALSVLDPCVADLVRLQIGPDTTWTDATARKIPQLALQFTDGRAG